jgi:hypothetical protein
VVTVATQPEDPWGRGHLKVLEDSCRRCGLELTVLGLGKKWTGPAMKLLLLADFLAGADDDAVYLFADAYDVVLLPNGGDLARRFRAFESPIVFSAESGCWPFAELAPSYPPAPVVKLRPRGRGSSLRPPPPLRTPFRFLNSGSYIGYAGAILRLIQEVSPQGTESDQGLFTRYYLEHRGDLALDYRATLFQTLNGVAPDDLVFEEGEPWTLRNRWLGSKPCLLHGNGPGRTSFLSVLSRLRARGWP